MLRTFFAFICLLSIPGLAIAVDLTGQVQADDGTPVCALVLASGRNVFSCNPTGPFSLANLPTEADGTVRLQVYAQGFRPFVRVLNNFDYQTVVMTRAGNCPVDDGLSDVSSLAGTYTFLRASVFFGDGSLEDSSAIDGNFSISGTMTISTGGVIRQNITATLDGETASATFSSNIVEDMGHALVIDDEDLNFVYTLSVLERGKKLTTWTSDEIFGGGEVDQWRKVSGAQSAQALSLIPANGTGIPVNAGSAWAEIVRTLGLRRDDPLKSR